MSRAIKTIGLLLVAMMVCLLPRAVAEPVDEFKVCARCHGQDGNSDNSDVPSIAGFSAQYNDAALRGYREGRRECATSKIKCRMAAKWTDEDIAGSAAHFAQFERVAPEQSFDSALAAQGETIHQEHCARCHSGEAVVAADTQPAGLLNGQWREYLEYSLEQYESGGREQPAEMSAALQGLGEEQVDALLDYYASGK